MLNTDNNIANQKHTETYRIVTQHTNTNKHIAQRMKNRRTQRGIHKHTNTYKNMQTYQHIQKH